jgi:hypothetical protein
MMDPKEEVRNELNKLVLEILHRLEPENPELLKLLFYLQKKSKSQNQKSEDRRYDNER